MPQEGEQDEIKARHHSAQIRNLLDTERCLEPLKPPVAIMVSAMSINNATFLGRVFSGEKLTVVT